jgi:hypothetical protein
MQSWIRKCELGRSIKEIDSNFNGGEVRGAYKLIKQLKGGFRAATRTAKDTSGKLLLEDKQFSESWAEYKEEFHTDKNTHGEGILKEDQQKKKRKVAVIEF